MTEMFTCRYCPTLIRVALAEIDNLRPFEPTVDAAVDTLSPGVEEYTGRETSAMTPTKMAA